MLRSSSDRRAFLALPRDLRRGDPVWVEPLRFDQQRLLSPGHAFYERGLAAEAAFFLARDGAGRAVGRIAAIANHLHNRHSGSSDGFFGFFDAINDQTVAEALLRAARTWLQERGMTIMYGPASPSHNYEYGLLLDGFDRPHRFMLAHNPAYYSDLLDHAGLTKARDLYAFPMDVFDPNLMAALERDGRRVELLALSRGAGITIRTANLRHLHQEVRIAADLINRSLERNWGYSPMTEGELKELADVFRYLVDPELVLFAERAGEPIAVSLALPDLNHLISRLRIRWGLAEMAELLVRFKLTRIPDVRIVAMGVARDRVSATVGSILSYRIYQRLAQRGVRCADASWILEDNTEMLLLLRRYGLQPDRTYRIYQQNLVSAG